MNRLPSPFQKDLPSVLTSTPNVPSSPGFLMITRPPSASNTPNHRNYSGGRSRSNFYSRPQTPYSNNSNFIAFKNKYLDNRSSSPYNNHSTQASPPFGNRNQSDGSPHGMHTFHGNSNYNRMSKNRNLFQRGSSFPGTPQNSFSTLSRNSKGTPRPNYNSNFRKNSHHKTPLKDIPIDKFVSRSMIANPWDNFDSDLENSSMSSTNDFEPIRNYESAISSETGSCSSSFSLSVISKANESQDLESSSDKESDNMDSDTENDL